MKKLSIIIPVYNGEKYICQTIESCLNQDYPFVEIIIIDDCSKDASRELIAQYDGIVKLYNSKNLGINRTLNKAVEHCSGEYLMFLGHDDMIRPNHASNTIDKFDNDTVLVYCNSEQINSNGDITHKVIRRNEYKNIKLELTKRNIIPATGLILRKDKFIEAGGFNEEFRNYGEWHLWIKLLNFGKVKYNPDIKAFYRKHETNITNSFNDIGVKINLKRYYEYSKSEAIKLFYHEFSSLEKLEYHLYSMGKVIKSKFTNSRVSF